MGRSRATSTAETDEAFDETQTPEPASPSGDSVAAEAQDAGADDAWAESLRDVLRKVIDSLPDHATLGELIQAARGNPAIAPVLDIFTVRELIETAKKKPKPATKVESKPAPKVDADGIPAMEVDAGPKVIRRRADVPDGDLRVLRSLSSQGPLKESELVSATELTSDQLRIIVRHLRTKGYIHIEGSATKRRVKITRNGGGYLRKHS
ncbi:MAG: hypothetical protein KUG77_05320 [Nannocystaceae bacterium]|nr:hypothetical protein [Nannocystaceae bacterium]